MGGNNWVQAYTNIEIYKYWIITLRAIIGRIEAMETPRYSLKLPRFTNRAKQIYVKNN